MIRRTIIVRDVLSRSAEIVYRRPILLLPQIIVLLPISLLTSPLSGARYSPAEYFSSIIPLLILTIIAEIVAFTVLGGAYPLLVRGTLIGNPVSMSQAFREGLGRFWSLLGASLLVALIVALGTIAFIVPGVIFATWYFYTLPAVMLEDKGALEGIKASKAFGKDRKWRTFLIFLGILLVIMMINAIQFAVSAIFPSAGWAVGFVLGIPIGAWVAVVPAYTYLTYGPSSY